MPTLGEQLAAAYAIQRWLQAGFWCLQVIALLAVTAAAIKYLIW